MEEGLAEALQRGPLVAYAPRICNGWPLNNERRGNYFSLGGVQSGFFDDFLITIVVKKYFLFEGN